jgi:hypothetical protein
VGLGPPIARDADLQIAETERGLFVEVPLAELKKKAETIRAEAPAVPEITFDPRMPPTIEDLLRAQIQLQTKMNRMERQLAELQRSIDRLNRLLEKKEDEKR